MRERIISNLRNLAISLGTTAEGTEWHIFGSVDRDEPDAADIDLMIFCQNDDQADSLRRAIDPDTLFLPLHLALMTFEEAAEVNAIRVQRSHLIFPEAAKIGTLRT